MGKTVDVESLSKRYQALIAEGHRLEGRLHELKQRRQEIVELLQELGVSEDNASAEVEGLRGKSEELAQSVSCELQELESSRN